MSFKSISFSIILLLVFSLIAADNTSVNEKSIKKIETKTTLLDSFNVPVTVSDSLDTFVDKNGDGIADNRNFGERNKNWHRTRNITKKMFDSGLGRSGSSGQPGKKAKSGNPGEGYQGGG